MSMRVLLSALGAVPTQVVPLRRRPEVCFAGRGATALRRRGGAPAPGRMTCRSPTGQCRVPGTGGAGRRPTVCVWLPSVQVTVPWASSKRNSYWMASTSGSWRARCADARPDPGQGGRGCARPCRSDGSAFHLEGGPPTSATGSAPIRSSRSTNACASRASAYSAHLLIGGQVRGEAGLVPHADHVPTVQEAAAVGASPGVGLGLGGEAGVDRGDGLALAVLHHPEARRGAQVALEGGLLQRVALLALLEEPPHGLVLVVGHRLAAPVLLPRLHHERPQRRSPVLLAAMHRQVRAVAVFDRQHPHLLGGGLGSQADGDGGALLASGPRQRLEVAKLGLGVAGVKWMWALDDDGVDGAVHQPSLLRSRSP